MADRPMTDGRIVRAYVVNCAVCHRINPPCGWAQPVIVVTWPPGLVCGDCERQRLRQFPTDPPLAMGQD